MSCIAFPHRPGVGGPGSFQKRFELALKQQGWTVVYAEDRTDQLPDVVMVVGGSKQISWLYRIRKQGIPIIYRLDGINWLHRKGEVEIKYYFFGEIRNLLNKFIHAFFADHVVYQSNFTRRWWEKAGWRKAKKYTIIHNGVDLDLFKPNSSSEIPTYLIGLEGTIDYSPYAIQLLNELAELLEGKLRLRLYGGFRSRNKIKMLSQKIDYQGKVAFADLPKVYDKAIYLSLDVNAACPNTVIEAMASGIPVVGFDTGALKELVGDSSGIVVPYGGDPWALDEPDAQALADAIIKVRDNWQWYAENARRRAEEHYDIKHITNKYLSVIESYQ